MEYVRGPIRAVTFDLWGTLIHDQDSPEKIQRRRAILLEALQEAGYRFEPEEMRAGMRRANGVAREKYVSERIDIGPERRWGLVTQALGVPDGLVPFTRVEAGYHDLTLEFLPTLLPGALDILQALHGRVLIGLICNTGFTGGTVLREVLAAHDLTRYFDTLTFSNEIGFLKPDAHIFRHTLSQLEVQPTETLHVGDLEDMDVAGALDVGMLAARYLPDGEDLTRGQFLIRSWFSFLAEIEELLPPSRDS